jgi:hypothetical protein
MTEPAMPTPPMPEYKGAPLDAERGPGLGCFWIQIVLLVVLLILTPLSVLWAWPSMVSAALLILSLVLLFFVGQTMIFLLRLVAADRRSRRRPLAPTARKTVGDLENIPRFESIEEVMAAEREEDAKHHAGIPYDPGTRVAVARTPATEAAGYAGRTGTLSGWTTPSGGHVPVIGSPPSDHAHGVNFDDGTEAWFDPDLLTPVADQTGSDQDNTGAS